MTLKYLISILAVASTLVGCSSGPQNFASGEIEHATDNAKVVKGIYDSSKGDINKVSATDKSKLLEIYKTDDKIKIAFEKMKHPPLGGGGAPPIPPQAQGN